ncbi:MULTISPECIES: hypothetical protein [Peribacillus]
MEAYQKRKGLVADGLL